MGMPMGVCLYDQLPPVLGGVRNLITEQPYSIVKVKVAVESRTGARKIVITTIQISPCLLLVFVSRMM